MTALSGPARTGTAPALPGAGGTPPRRWVIAGVALAVLIGLAAMGVRLATGALWIDLEVYRDAALAVLHGRNPYDFVNHNGLMFNYTPFAALLLTPLGLAGMPAGVLWWTILSALTLLASVWLVLRHFGVAEPRRTRLTVLLALVCLPMLPILHSLELGQINIMLMLLVLADLLGGRRAGHGPGGRWQGVGLGIAAGIKLTPLIFVPYLVLTGRIRAAVTAVGTFAATAALGFLLLPGTSWAYWLGGHVTSSGRLSPPDTEIYNQSLRGALVRLSDSGADAPGWVWPLLALVAGVAAMTVAVRAGRRGHELAGILACALAALLVSPISWHTHWVWCVPLVLLTGRAALRTRRAWPVTTTALAWLVF
ncbi:glycosyltransferase 87 family protein, partial [Actinoplanes sp. RD1]|uniref:glycosyltransferase 87 family protein n=1 Tax=Actinoplanes sp. RD1 TaxID=3064538 RepID=UPI0027424DB1